MFKKSKDSFTIWDSQNKMNQFQLTIGKQIKLLLNRRSQIAFSLAQWYLQKLDFFFWELRIISRFFQFISNCSYFFSYVFYSDFSTKKKVKKLNKSRKSQTFAFSFWLPIYMELQVLDVLLFFPRIFDLVFKCSFDTKQVSVTISSIWIIFWINVVGALEVKF